MNASAELSKDSERRKLQEDIERLQNVIGDDDFNSDEDSDNDNLQIDITTEHGEDSSSRIPSQAGSIVPEVVAIDDRDTEEIVINLNENVPIDPDTCLALNKAYQEVLLDTLRSIEMALIENREKQSQLQECLDDPKKEKTGEGRSRRTITSYHKPFFMDTSGEMAPNNMDVQLKIRTGEIHQTQKPQTAWRNKMKTDLKEAVYLDSLGQQTRHLINRKEIYYEKLSAMSMESNGEEYTKLMDKIEDIDKEVDRIQNLPKEEVLALADMDKVDWMKISKTVLNNLRDPTECELYWRNILNPAINRGEFSKAEKEKLQSLAKKHGQKNWPEIAKELGTNRTPFQCFQYYQQNLNDAINKREWTENEDQALLEVVDSCRIGKSTSWNNVAYYIEGRSSTQCSIRWSQINPLVKHGKWTTAEDMKLLSSIYIYGEKWDKVSEAVPGRTPVQCRERYRSALDPKLLAPSEWTYEEDKKLLELADEFRKPDGKISWARVAENLTGRTDNNVLFRHRKLMQWKEKCEWLDKQDTRSKEELGYLNIEKLATESKRKNIKRMNVDLGDEVSHLSARQRKNEEDYARLKKELRKLPLCEYRFDYVKQLRDKREGKRVVPRPPLMYRTTRKAPFDIWARKKHLKTLLEKHLSQLNITNAEDRVLIPEKTAEQFSPFSILNPKQMAKVEQMLQYKLPSEISVRDMIDVTKSRRTYTTVKVKEDKRKRVVAEIEGKIKEILLFKYCYITKFRKPSGRPKKFYIFYPNGRKPKYFDAENPVQLSTVTSTLLFNALEVDGKKVIEAYNKLPKKSRMQLKSLYDLLCRCFPHLASIPVVISEPSVGASSSQSVPMITAGSSSRSLNASSASTSVENEEGRKSWMIPVGQPRKKRGRLTKAELLEETKTKRPDNEMSEIVNTIIQKTRRQVSGQGKTWSSKSHPASHVKDLTVIGTSGEPLSTTSLTGVNGAELGIRKNSAGSEKDETPSKQKRKASEPFQTEVVTEKVSKLSTSDGKSGDEDKCHNENPVDKGRQHRAVLGHNIVDNTVLTSITEVTRNEEQAAMSDLYSSERRESSQKHRKKSFTLSETEAAEIAKAKLVKSIAAKRNSADSNNTGSTLQTIRNAEGPTPAKIQKTLESTDKQPLSLPISPPDKNLPTIVPLSTKNLPGGPVPTALVVNAGTVKLKPGQQIVQVVKSNLTGANVLKPGQELQQKNPKVIVLKQTPRAAAPNKFPILPPCVTTMRGYEELLIQKNMLKSRAAELYNPYFYCEKDAVLSKRVKPVIQARNITSRLNLDTKLDRLEEVDAKRINSFLDAKHPRNYGPFVTPTHPRKDLLKDFRDTEEFVKLKKRFDALFLWPAFLALLRPDSENFFDKQAEQEKLVTFDEFMVDSDNDIIMPKKKTNQQKKQKEKKEKRTSQYRMRHFQKKRIISEKRRIAKQMQIKAIQEKGRERIRAERRAKAEEIKCKQIQKWGSLVGSRSSERIFDKVEAEREEETVGGIAKSSLKVKSLNLIDRVIQYKKKGSNIRQAVARASMKKKKMKLDLDDTELTDMNKCIDNEDFTDMKPFSTLKRMKSATVTGVTDPVTSQLQAPGCPPGYVMVPVVIPPGVNIPSSTTGASPSKALPPEFLQSLMLMPQASPGTSSTPEPTQPYPVLMLAKGEGSNLLPVFSLSSSGSQLPVTNSSVSTTAPLVSLLSSPGGSRTPLVSIIPPPVASMVSTAPSEASITATVGSSVSFATNYTKIPDKLSPKPSTPAKMKISPKSPVTASITSLLGKIKKSPASTAATYITPTTFGNPGVSPVAHASSTENLSLMPFLTMNQDGTPALSASSTETLPSQDEKVVRTSTSVPSQIHEQVQISSTVLVEDSDIQESDDSPDIVCVSGEDNSSVSPIKSCNNTEDDTSHVFVGSVPGQGNTPMLISVPKDSNMTVKELIQMMGNQMNKGDN